MTALLAPITADDLPAVAHFMHAHLNPRVPVRAWEDAVRVPWEIAAPNHGFLLRDGEAVVGAYLAYYSQRDINGRTEQFCNLGAWCVLEGYRQQGLRLLTALLKQPGYHFTDFSPSGNVVPLNRRLKLTELDTATVLLPNLPLPPRRDIRVTGSPARLLAGLPEPERRLYLDHRTTRAAHHLLLTAPEGGCWVVFRRDTRKHVRAFASVLHVSDPAVFRRHARRVGAHLLTRHGIPATLVERRVCDGTPAGGIALSRSRPKMFRSESLGPDHIDYLYSELTCLPW